MNGLQQARASSPLLTDSEQPSSGREVSSVLFQPRYQEGSESTNMSYQVEEGLSGQRNNAFVTTSIIYQNQQSHPAVCMESRRAASLVFWSPLSRSELVTVVDQAISLIDSADFGS